MLHLCVVVKPLPMKYASAKAGRKGGSGGHGNGNRSSMKDQEKMLVSILGKLIQYLNVKCI